jgi:UDP-N-acetylmuramyl pentapeptide phosphotransferase/UDP-N-acetylglucosamine-1-phosphate transferase
MISLLGNGILCRVLAGKGILDVPNARSSHQQAKPRGGGIAIAAAVAAGIGILIFTGAPLPEGVLAVGTAALVLALISWADDVRGLPPLARFIPQIICVGATLYILPLPVLPYLDTLPDWLQQGLLAMAWLWFINLYNFMDGIDGITGVETLVITLGIAAVCVFITDPVVLQGPALVIAAAAAGFLIWNWAPAKIFMGDVGSVPLGFVLGWLLLEFAAEGYLAAALILPGYYLLDATVTLLARLRRGEKIWQAHRQHAYQTGVQGRLSHARVAALIGLLGICLIGLGILSLSAPWVAVVAGTVLTAGLFSFFKYWSN